MVSIIPVTDPDILAQLNQPLKATLVEDPDILAQLSQPSDEENKRLAAASVPQLSVGTRGDVEQMGSSNAIPQVADSMKAAWLGNAEHPDLPHLAETDVFNQQTGWGQNIANVFRSPDTMADAFIRDANKGAMGREPKWRKATDKNGNIIIEENTGSGYKPFAYANTPGVDWRDTRDFLIEGATYAVPAGATLHSLKALPWVLRTGGLATADVATMSTIKGLTGEDISPADIGIAVGTSVLGEATSPIWRSLVGKSVFSEKELAAAAQKAMDAGVANPKPETVRMFAEREAGQIDPRYTDKSLIVAGETGMPMYRSDLMPEGTQAERLAKGKQRAREAGLSDVPEMAEQANEQAIKTQEYIENQRVVQNARRPEAETGHDFIRMIRGEADRTKTQARDLYAEREFARDLSMESAEQQLGVSPMVKTNRGYQAGTELTVQNQPNPMVADLKNRMNILYKNEGMGSTMNTTTDESKRFLNKFQSNLDEIVERGTWSVGELDDMLRSFNKAIRDTKGSDKNIIGKAKKQYMDWVENVMMPAMDEVEQESLGKLLRASEIYGGYLSRFDADDVTGKIIADIANGNADAQRVIPALFGDTSIKLTGKQANTIVNLLPDNQKAEMIDLMKEGVYRRIFTNMKTGRAKDSAQAVLDEIDSLIGKGNATELGSFLFRSGSKERQDLMTVQRIMEFVADENKMKQKATGQQLSKLYARINTPFGFRVVTALPDWHARLFRGRRARAMLDPLKAVRGTEFQTGATVGATIAAGTNSEEQQ